MFQDALFDFRQPIVALVQRLFGQLHVHTILRLLCPRQVQQPVDVRTRHADLRRHAVHAAQACQFLFGFGMRHVRHGFGAQALAQRSHFLRVRVAFTQLRLNRPHLLAQEYFALAFIHLVLYLQLDAVFQFQHVQLFGEHDAELLQARNRFNGFEDRLSPGHVQRDGLCDQVGQPARVVDVHRIHECFFRQALVQPDHALEQRQRCPHQCLGGRRVCLWLADHLHAGGQEWGSLRPFHDAHA